MPGRRSPRQGGGGPRPGRAGLTLIELLIGVVLTSIVVAGTYVMFGTSSEVFHHQELSAENQNNVRFAADLLQRDIEHAGFNGTPNAAADPLVCPKPGFTVPGIYIIPDQTLTTSAGVSITFDQLAVIGDSSLTGPVPISSVTSNSITVDVTTSTPTMTVAEFTAAFATNKIVRLVNPEGIAQFAKVTDVNAGTGQITVDSLQEAASGACGYSPLATANHEVNALTGYLYTLREDADDPTKTDLVRWEVDLGESAVTGLANTDVVVAEYVVGLDFMLLGVGAGSSPTAPTVPFETNEERATFTRDSSASVLTDTQVQSNPELARYVLYRIHTRTRRAIPRRLVMPSSAVTSPTSEKMFFDLGDDKVAEVRTLQGRIALPNFVLRNLQ